MDHPGEGELDEIALVKLGQVGGKGEGIGD